MVKFTKVQIEFLASIFLFVEKEFVEEAEAFVGKKKVVKPAGDNERCCAIKKDGGQCTKRFIEGETMCSIHLKNPPVVVVKIEKVRCCGLTKKGGECRNYAVDDGKCNRHMATPQALSAEIVV